MLRESPTGGRPTLWRLGIVLIEGNLGVLSSGERGTPVALRSGVRLFQRHGSAFSCEAPDLRVIKEQEEVGDPRYREEFPQALVGAGQQSCSPPVLGQP